MADLPKQTQRKPLSPRNRRRAGAALLEFALTVLPTFGLILAFVDFGLLLFRWATLQNAVREGCRYAITFQTTGTSGQDASIEAVVQHYAMGMVSPTDNPQDIFVKYYSPTNLTSAIASGGNVPGNIVEVSVQGVSWSWIAPLSGSSGSGGVPFLRSATPITLNIYSSDILGGFPAGQTSVQE
ncbi:MAG TPA: TadE/TadG family type IV pilus assembly protein [Bryobacteraceae bacterium]|jgi:Flp pilus assembly protein TadG|nr:TadE/TadG family type IV pilus assembly protein [Bryobacteraceae bacterium]